MRAGQLRRLITIQTPTESLTAGESAPTWATLAQVYAEEVPLSAREAAQAQMAIAAQVTRWRIRHRTDLTTKMRISFDGRTCQINQIIDPDGRHRELLLVTTEIVA